MYHRLTVPIINYSLGITICQYSWKSIDFRCLQKIELFISTPNTCFFNLKRIMPYRRCAVGMQNESYRRSKIATTWQFNSLTDAIGVLTYNDHGAGRNIYIWLMDVRYGHGLILPMCIISFASFHFACHARLWTTDVRFLHLLSVTNRTPYAPHRILCPGSIFARMSAPTGNTSCSC